MFHLIEFLRNGTVAVLPQSWYGDGSCLWPNYMRADRVDRAVQRAEEPGPDWQTHDVRVIRPCGNYLDATRALKKYKSCNTPGLQSEEGISIKRESMPGQLCGDSDDDSEKETPPHKKARGPTTSGTFSPPPPLLLTPSPPPLDSGSPAREQKPSTSQLCSRRCGSACCAAQVHMMGLMEKMKRQLDQLLARVDDLASKTHAAGREADETGEPVKLPLTSVEEVDLFEKRLEDPANILLKTSVISCLATIGGHDAKRITWNILARMFSDDVGKSISWKGVNGKKSFSQMMSKTLLLHAVRKNHVTRAATDDEILKHAIRWFNLASDRGSRRRHGPAPAL